MAKKKEAVATAPEVKSLQPTQQPQQYTEQNTGQKFHDVYAEAIKIQSENKRLKTVLGQVQGAIALL